MEKAFIRLKTNMAKRFKTKVITDEQIEVINQNSVHKQTFAHLGELECFIGEEICRQGLVYNAHNFDEADFYEKAEMYFDKSFNRLIDHQDCQTIDNIVCADGGIYKVCISILEEKHVSLRNVIKDIACTLSLCGLGCILANFVDCIHKRTMVYFSVYRPNGEPAWQCGRTRGCHCT